MKRMVKLFDRQTFRGSATPGTVYRTSEKMAELIGQGDEVIIHLVIFYSEGNLSEAGTLSFQLKSTSVSERAFWDVAKNTGSAVEPNSDGVASFSTTFAGRAGFQLTFLGAGKLFDGEIWATIIEKGV